MNKYQRISLGIQAIGTALVVGICFLFAKRQDNRLKASQRMSDEGIERLIKDIHEPTLVIDNRGEVEGNG